MTDMNHRFATFRNATLMAFTLGLALSSCAPAQNAPHPATPTVTASNTSTATPTATAIQTATPTPTATATPAAAATSATPITTPTAPAPSLAPVSPKPVLTPKPVVPQLATFTFPDGHISFEHPAQWTVKTEQGPYLDHEGETDKARSIEASIYDESGSKVAQIASGGYGGGASGPSVLAVLDSKAMPALPALKKGGNATFAFIHYASEDRYFMGLINDQFVVEGNGSSGSPYLLLPNGASLAMVEFDKPTFTSPARAKSWMSSKQYSQLKAMITSVRYA